MFENRGLTAVQTGTMLKVKGQLKMVGQDGKFYVTCFSYNKSNEGKAGAVRARARTTDTDRAVLGEPREGPAVLGRRQGAQRHTRGRDKDTAPHSLL